MMSARDALATATAYTDGTIETLTAARSVPVQAKLIDEITGGLHDARLFTPQARSRIIRQVGPATFRQLLLVATTAEAARMWRRHRIVYHVHDDLLDSLSATPASVAVPCEVLARLPHPDPFIAFPNPLPATIGDNGPPLAQPPVYTGMLVTGYTETHELCSTTDPRLHTLNVALGGYLRYEGQARTYEEHVLTFPIEGTLTVDEMVQQHFVAARKLATPDDDDRYAYTLALSLLLYLCSDQPDMRASAAPSRRGKGKRQRPKDAATVVDVGFDIGPKLGGQQSRRDDGEDSSSATTGRTVRSHIRRAHWHTYNTGPRTNPTRILRWVHPTIINPTHRTQGRATIIDVD